MIRWFAKNDIVANILMLAVIVAGFFIALPQMAVEINPVYKKKSVYVSLYARGYTPEDMEKLIAIPLESSINNIDGVKKITLYANYSSVFLNVEGDDSANISDLKNEVQAAVNNLSTLPSDVDPPKVFIPDESKRKEVTSLIITGDLPSEELIKVARQVRDDLLSKGTSFINIQGIRNRRIFIEPELEALNTHGLTLTEISSAISNNSIELTAGRIGSSARGFVASAKNQAITVNDFTNIPIKASSGTDLRIGDVAKVIDSADEESKIIMLNEKPCIRVEVMRLGDESALKVADIVSGYAKQAEVKFPEGIKLHIWDDTSIALRSRIEILKDNLIQGAVLVIIVLTLFLRPSLAFFVVIGVPISFAGGLLLMYLMGVTINMWTLFGFIIVLGIVVDDAIVTAENIHTHLEKNTNRLDAVVNGTKEVATPVTFGVLTTIVAFIPLMFLSGPLGNIASQIPLVIIPVLIFSLIESKFILPGHLKHNHNIIGKLNPFPIIHKGVQYVLNAIVEYIYKPILTFCLAYRHAVILASIAVLLSTFSYINSDHFKMSKSPKINKNVILASLEMKSDAELLETHEKVLDIVNAAYQLAKEFPDGKTGKSLVGNVYHSTGGKSHKYQVSPNKGFVYLEVTPPILRDKETKDADFITNQTIATRWQELIGEVEGAENVDVKGLIQKSRAFSEEQQIEIEIRGNNEEAKTAVTEEMKLWLKEQEWCQFANHNIGRPSKQMNFKINENGIAAGLTDRSLATQVRQLLLGIRAQKFYQGEDQVQVDVRLPESIRENPHALNKLRIKTADGYSSFRSLADIEETEIRPRILRVDRSRIFKITARTTPNEDEKLDQHIKTITTKLNELAQSQAGVTWRFTGQIARDAETEKRMYIGGISLCFVIFALLAIPFKSIVQPFFVIFAVPLGIAGALLGHYHLGVTISYLSIFGLLALCGVVVNDSLVIVDYINKKKTQYSDIKETVLMSGVRRFRPILLTSLTTFVGLYPIMMETSPQAAFLRPMAISLGFGILYATLITLIVIPCLYLVFEDIKKALKWYIGKK